MTYQEETKVHQAANISIMAADTLSQMARIDANTTHNKEMYEAGLISFDEMMQAIKTF